jgi:O-antigen/teichoic acid export membrane protein
MPSIRKLLNSLTVGIRRIIKGEDGAAATIQTVLSRFFILAINLATGVITARLLGPAGRGEQAAMTLWPIFLANAFTLGLPASVTYNLKAFPQHREGLVSAALLLGSLIGSGAGILGAVCMPWWLSQYSPPVIYFAQWMMVVAPLCLVLLICTTALEAIEEFTISNQAYTLLHSLVLVFLGAFLLTGTLTPFTSALAYGLIYLPVLIWTLSRLLPRLPLSWQKTGKLSKQLIGYGLRSYGIDLLKTLSLQMDQVFIISLLTPTSMGMYVVVLSIARILNVFCTSAISVLLPKTVARPLDEVMLLTGRVVRISTIVSLIVGLVLVIFSPTLLQLLYGNEFTGAVPVLRILILEVVLGGMTVVLAQAFMALEKPGIVAILQTISFGLSLPLMIGLAPVYGLIGIGCALLGATCARLILMLACYPLVLKVPPPNLLLTRDDLHFLKQMLLKKS